MSETDGPPPDTLRPAAEVRAPARQPAADSAARDVTTAEIAGTVAKVFGDSAPPPMTDSAAAPGAPVWDIDVHSYETHARVEHFVDVFSGRAKPQMEESLRRQSRYGALIGQKLREGGLPEDVTYLALIESWYDPHAYSKAAAVGMWQFMTGTARGVGMRVDWWVDERRDPVRSTEGAVRLLKSLRDQFGSLYLAAAAYNGGDGRVSRGLVRYAGSLEGVEGEDRFFTLADTKYLRPETRDYVPKLIAAALVGKEPARYGINVESMPPFAFDSVRVSGATPLAAISKATGTDVAAIKDLNPHVLRGMTPPDDTFWVRVPAGAAAGYDERFSALEPGEREAFVRVKSKTGESMSSIAKKHGLSAKQLNWYNPKATRLKSGNLVAGQPILVPTRATVAAAMDVPNPSIERYPRRAGAVASRTHLVARGETLDAIAKKYGTSTATLMRLNGMQKALILPGQNLVVRSPAPAAAAKRPVRPKP
ncbi:MAG: transglycosylase SLT domain-containing protein [Gemmatimonadales bacterium]